MATPASLQSAPEAYTVQAQIAAAAVVAARAVRPQTAEAIAQVVAAYQLLAAQQAIGGTQAMLAEQGLSTAAAASVIAQSLAGYTSAGYPLATMFQMINSPAHLAMLVASAVQDAGRNGASLQMAVTPSATGYVRMLNPPSCSRCAVLAGKFYKWNAGFERHPNCDCRHIPTTESLSGDLTTDPAAYFESLPTAAQVAIPYPNLTRKMRNEAGIFSQEDIFTVAGAQAIRDGADIGQVVNARRGMSTAQPGVGRLTSVELYGKQAFITREGITVRGAYGKARGQLAKEKGQRYRATTAPRLMPETLYAIATDRNDALRLLTLYGYIRP